MDKPKFKQFELPDKILRQLYELTGSAECYKGFIMAYCDENGTPVIYVNCESQITESGLIKSIENYIQECSQNIFEAEEELD
tara:strand:+ start:1717 stop:1962 length:246 start_codon:yes stop_codon:yes gene_type:complete